MRDGADLLALWDEATRREPIIREFVDEPRWRTEADGVPFTGTKFAAIFGTMPLDHGNETANPADIPLLVDEIVSFAAREDLPPELVACGMPYLVFRVHPFKDGNGHVLRMLTCSLMHAAGYHEAVLLAYIDLIRERHNDMCNLSREVSLGKAQTEDHAIFHMKTMVDAQRSVLENSTAIECTPRTICSELMGGDADERYGKGDEEDRKPRAATHTVTRSTRKK